MGNPQISWLDPADGKYDLGNQEICKSRSLTQSFQWLDFAGSPNLDEAVLRRRILPRPPPKPPKERETFTGPGYVLGDEYAHNGEVRCIVCKDRDARSQMVQVCSCYCGTLHTACFTTGLTKIQPHELTCPACGHNFDLRG